MLLGAPEKATPSGQRGAGIVEPGLLSEVERLGLNNGLTEGDNKGPEVFTK